MSLSIAVGIAAIFHALSASGQFKYTLDVSDEAMIEHRGFWTRNIGKGEVKSVVETPARFFFGPGLRISKHGHGFATWLWGGIWIPRGLPGYDDIRSVALSWQRSVG
jgi:hypothetical protein